MAYKILTKDHIVAILMALAPRFVGRDQDHLLGLADEAAWAAYDRAYDAIEPLQEFDQLLQGPAGASVIGITDLGNYYTGTTIEEALEQVGAFIDEGPYIRESEKAVPNGVATLAGDGRLEPGQLPQLAITDTFEASSEAAMLGLPAEKGDVAVRTDLNQSFILAAEPASALGNWTLLRSPTDSVTSVFGRVGVVTAEAGDYTAAQVGADPAGTAAALLTQTITDGDTTHTPSGDAVFDALAGKADASGVWALGISGPAVSSFSGDLNDAIGSHGVYASGSTNRPPPGNGFVWGNTLSSGSYGIQEWGRNDRRFFRTLEAGSWGPWVEYFHTGNFDPATKADISGSTEGVKLSRSGNSPYVMFEMNGINVAQIRGLSSGGIEVTDGSAAVTYATVNGTGLQVNNGLLVTNPGSLSDGSTVAFSSPGNSPGIISFNAGSYRSDIRFGAGELYLGASASTSSPSAGIKVSAAGWIEASGGATIGNGRIYTGQTYLYLCGNGSEVGIRPHGWSTANQALFKTDGTITYSGVGFHITSGTSDTQIYQNGVFARDGNTIYLRPRGAGTSTNQVTINTSGNVTANDFISTSDAAFKYDIEDFQLRAPLRPRQYKWIDDDCSDIGFVAQEVQKDYPELVVATRDEDDGPEYLRLNYAKLTVVLAAQINELQKQIEELKEKLDDGR